MNAERLVVGLGDRSYPIVIGEGLLATIGSELRAIAFPRRVAVVSNPTVTELYGELLRQALEEAGFEAQFLLIGDGEEFKNAATLDTLYQELIEGGFDRGSGLLALGGGVVGDIAGFAAATYLRGIPFAQLPTTLLAQVDSSVGGKTAINHRLGKNLIGAFYQPRLVLIDVATLQSLPEREYAAGLAEVVKYGVIRDAAFFRWLEMQRPQIATRQPAALVPLVKRACQIKADVVEIDEKEGSLRAVLNFGHTFGHALETLLGYGTLRHGEAVAVGMLVAAAMAWQLELCDRADVVRLRELLTGFDLPVQVPDLPLEQVLDVMGRDKKVQGGVLRLVLNRGIGDCLIREVAEPVSLLQAGLERLEKL